MIVSIVFINNILTTAIIIIDYFLINMAIIIIETIINVFIFLQTFPAICQVSTNQIILMLMVTRRSWHPHNSKL